MRDDSLSVMPPTDCDRGSCPTARCAALLTSANAPGGGCADGDGCCFRRAGCSEAVSLRGELGVGAHKMRAC